MKVEDDNDEDHDDHDDYVDDFYNDNHTDKNWEDTLPNLEAISVHRGPGRPRRIQSYNENVLRDTVSQIVPWRLSIPDMASVSGFVSRWRQSM